jgi:hypothetical protein
MFSVEFLVTSLLVVLMPGTGLSTPYAPVCLAADVGAFSPLSAVL